MKRGMKKALEELHRKYNSGPSEGDCEGDYDFGFASGMKTAYENMAEDLKILIAEFYPRPAGKRRR